MNEAIKKAIEGGYHDTHRFFLECENEYAHYLIDPLFWQALGKDEGWDEGEAHDEIYALAPHMQWMWQFKWHRFIDHLAEGKDIDSFFNDLLKKYE